MRTGRLLTDLLAAVEGPCGDWAFAAEAEPDRVLLGSRDRDLPVQALAVGDALVQRQFRRRRAHHLQRARAAEAGTQVSDVPGLLAGRESQADVVGIRRWLPH